MLTQTNCEIPFHEISILRAILYSNVGGSKCLLLKGNGMNDKTHGKVGFGKFDVLLLLLRGFLLVFDVRQQPLQDHAQSSPIDRHLRRTSLQLVWTHASI